MIYLLPFGKSNFIILIYVFTSGVTLTFFSFQTSEGIMYNNSTLNGSYEGPAEVLLINQTEPFLLPSVPPPDAALLEELHKILQSIKRYFVPPVIGVGIVGNLLTIIGLLCRFTKGVEGSLFLAAKATTDFLFLCAYTFLWLSEFGVTLYHSAGWCQFLTFVNNSSTFLSVWYTVCIAVERFLSLHMSRNRHRFSSPIKVKITIIGLALVAVPVYLNISLTNAVQKVHTMEICMPLPMFYDALGVLNKIDAFLNVMLPSSIILLFSILNVIKIHSPAGEPVSCANLTRCRRCSDLTQRDHNESCFSIIACVVCFLQVILCLPSSVFRLKLLLQGILFDGFVMTQKMYLIQTILMYPFYASFSVNIFIVIYWSSFRKNIVCFLKNAKVRLVEICKNNRRELQCAEETESLNL